MIKHLCCDDHNVACFSICSQCNDAIAVFFWFLLFPDVKLASDIPSMRMNNMPNDIFDKNPADGSKFSMSGIPSHCRGFLNQNFYNWIGFYSIGRIKSASLSIIYTSLNTPYFSEENDLDDICFATPLIHFLLWNMSVSSQVHYTHGVMIGICVIPTCIFFKPQELATEAVIAIILKLGRHCNAPKLF